jgi:hypothetical protein
MGTAQKTLKRSADQLSLRAFGLLNFYVRSGGYIPTNKVILEFSEGRDAIRTALAELVTHGLVEVEQYQVGNQWSTSYQLRKGLVLDPVGFSGSLTEGQLTITNDLSTSTNQLNTITTMITNKAEESEDISKLRLVSKKEKEKEKITSSPIQVGWPKQLGIQSHRSSKSEDDWTTQDLATEFSFIAYSEGFADPGSIPGNEVARIINRLVSDGLTRYQILQLIRKFFWVNNWPGRRNPRSLWASFMSFAYSWKDTVEVNSNRSEDKFEFDMEAHQAKMLRLLDG